MSNIIKKLIFLFKRPPVVLIAGKDRSSVKEFVSRVLKSEVLIFESDLLELRNFSFFLKNSKLPILVVNQIDDTLKSAQILPVQGFLVLNFDDESIRKIKNESLAHFLTYGFQEGADLKATDININSEGTNFKINYQGNIVPFWLKNIFNKEQIYNALAATAVGIINNINLVEISQALQAWAK